MSEQQTTFPPFQMNQPGNLVGVQLPTSAGPTVIPAATPESTAPKVKKKRGGRRHPIAAASPAPEPKPVREPRRNPKRPAKRPRTNPLRRPKRSPARTAVPDFEKTAAIMAGFQAGDGALLTAVSEQLQAAPLAQRKRVLAILNRVFE